MTALDSLLAAVLAAPHDDLPRLVYADALEETGEEGNVARAQFVREQITTGTAKYERLRYSVLEPFGYRAVDPFEPIPRDTATVRELDVVRRRGFIAEVSCTLAAWCGSPCPCVAIAESRGHFDNTPENCPLCSGTFRENAHGPALVRRHPVETVTLTDREPQRNPHGFEWRVPGQEVTAGQDRESHSLPLRFDNFLIQAADSQNGRVRNRQTWGYHLTFPTLAAALAALSSACRAWAKAVPPEGG